jgi:CHAT domain-containing protein/Tfp pilus assembly protein PilF/uncharacterized protein YchJ
MNARVARLQLLAGVAFLLLACPSFAAGDSDRAPVEAVVRRFYAAYAGGDLEALLATWKPDAPALAAFRETTAPVLRARCMTLHALTFDSVAVAGERAAVSVHVMLSKSARTMPERYDPHSATLQLIRVGGDWRVTQWMLREEEFADRLAAAHSDAEREALLQGEPQLLTPALDRALGRRALLVSNQDHFAEATTLMNLVNRVSAAIDDPAGSSMAAGLESILRRRVPPRDLPASLALAYRSVDLAEESSDPDVIARATQRAGRALYSLERIDEALPLFQRAFSLRDELEDDWIVSISAGQIAQIYSNRGDHHASTYFAEIARATARDDLSLGGAELNLGGEYASEGDCRLAIPHLKRSIELSRKGGFIGVTGAHWALAHCYLAVGQDKAALRLTSEALVTLGPNPDPEGALALLIERSHYFARAGQRAASEADLLEGLRLARSGDRPDNQISVLAELAAFRLRQRRYTEANALAHSAVSLARGFIPGPLLLEARAERHLGHRAAAYRILRSLIQATEENAAGITSDERQRQIFFESRADAYLELADMLVDDGRFAEALVIAERCKGRLLLDVLHGGKLLQYASLTPAERDREAALELRIARLNMESAASPANEETVAQPLREARRELEDYRTELCLKYPRLATHHGPAALSLANTTTLLPDTSTAFIEYLVTDTRLVIFVVTRGSHPLHVHTIPLPKGRLESETAALVHALSERDLRFRARARRLYDLLLAPAAAELQGVQTVAIIPDGPLWQLPFESLVLPDGRFLIEQMACFYAPSISVYREMVRQEHPRPTGNFLAFANPPGRDGDAAADAKLRNGEAGPLPDAEREVEHIARLFREGTRLYVGPDALESRVKAESAAYDVLHFATHGVLDDNNPMYSHLLLAPSSGDATEDGFLETWELMRLDLHAELAVLSACDTARGTVHAGEGLIGMSWALFVAGCSSTVATQWKVPSAPAADLMIDFYDQWLHTPPGTSFAKAEALRQARLHLMRDGMHRDPYYWSGYVLIGSGK